jgi:hypothetical protein
MNNITSALVNEVEHLYTKWIKNTCDDEHFEYFKSEYLTEGKLLKESVNQFIDLQLQAYLDFDKGKNFIQD